MILKMKDIPLYGSTYLSENFLQKPFFLGVEGISGEPEEGMSWKLSFNPVLLNVYDNINLDDLTIFLLHVRHYNCFRNYSINCKFYEILMVFSKTLDRIDEVINLETSCNLDTIMAAYNLLAVMADMVIRFHPVLRYHKSVDEINTAIIEFRDFQLKLGEDINNNHEKYAQISHCPIIALFSILANMMFRLRDASYIIEQNDLKTLSPIVIMSNLSNSKLLPNLVPENFKDEYFTSPQLNIQITGDFFRIVKYTYSSKTNFALLQTELSDRDLDFENFQYYIDDSIIDSKNFENFKALKQSSEQSFTSTSEKMDYCDIAIHFVKCFWKRKYMKNEQNEYNLLKPNQTRFIFQFTIRMLISLKKIPLENPNHKKIFVENLELLGNILNFVRFSEIDAAISLKTAVILSKTLEELLTDPTVRSFIQRMPSEIMLVVARITSFLGFREKCAPLLIISKNNIIEFSITDLKPIENVCQIPKIRRGKWKNIILGNTTSANGDQFFNRDECPVCYNKQQTEDSCHLVCRHTLCSSCTKTISDKNKLARCPVCRNPFFEYLPSKKLANICMEQLQ